MYTLNFVLTNRLSRIEQVYCFTGSTLPQSAHEEFSDFKHDAESLLADVSNGILDIPSIEAFLTDGEDFIEAIGIELPGEFCSVSSFLKRLKDEKLLVLIYLNS